MIRPRFQKSTDAYGGPGAGAALLLLVLLPGCQEDEIRRYQAPRPEPPKPKMQMLAAMVPHGERTWFFKVMGPTDQVQEAAAQWEAFLRSVRFSDQKENPVQWQLPEGWEQAAGNSPGRHATIRVGPKERGLELTVVALGRESGSLLDNVNRWRGQIGLQPVDAEALPEMTKKTEIGGAPATLVTLSGPGSKKPPMGPMGR